MRQSPVLICVILTVCIVSCELDQTPTPGSPVAMEIPSDANVAGPRFSKGADGELVLSWMATGESATTLKYSPLVDGKFTTVFEVVTEPRAFVNWADLPSVVPLDGDHWIAHWLRYSADATYSYDVVFSQSFDGGVT